MKASQEIVTIQSAASQLRNPCILTDFAAYTHGADYAKYWAEQLQEITVKCFIYQHRVFAKKQKEEEPVISQLKGNE